MIRKSLITIDDFTGGLNVYDRPHHLRSNQTADMMNAIFSQKGSVQKRKGYKRVVDLPDTKGGMRGILSYVKMPTEDDPDAEIERYLLLFWSDKIYTWKEGESGLTEIGVLGSGTKTVRGVIYDNEIVFGDGENPTRRWDGTTLNTVGNAPKSDCFMVFNEIFLARDSKNPNVLKYPDPSDVTDWTPTDSNNAGFVAPESHNGEMVMGMAKFQNKLICFKETGKYALPLEFDEENKTIGFTKQEFDDGDDGLRSTHSIIHGENTLFFLGNGGFKNYGMQEGYPDRRASKNLSFAINPLLEKIQEQYTDKISAQKWKNMYMVCVPLDGYARNNAVIIFDTVYSGWGLWDIPMVDCVNFRENEQKNLYFADSTSPALHCLCDEFIDDLGGQNKAIEFWYETPELNIGGDTTRIDVVKIEGYMTIPQKSLFSIITNKKTETFPITEKDVLDGAKNRKGVGNINVSSSGVSSEDENKMVRFEKIIQFPKTVNESSFFKFRIENNEKNQNIEIQRIQVLGNTKENSLKRKG